MTMPSQASDIMVSLLNFCIAILNVKVVETLLGKEVFELASTILVFVKFSIPPLLHPL